MSTTERRMKSINEPTNFFSEQRLKDNLRSEETDSELREYRRTQKLQATVMTLALIKYFVVCSLQSTNTFLFSNSIAGQSDIIPQLEGSFYIFQFTIVTSFLLFGNLIDNTINHQRLVMLCDFLLGTAYFIYGLLFLLSEGKSKVNFKSDQLQTIATNMELLINIIAPSIILVIQLQLFNWFSKKKIAVVYGIYSFVQTLAYIPTILIKDEQTYQVWYKYVAGGLVLYLYVAIDWRWFKFFPLEADVFIDVSGRSKKDRETFQQI